ncbi:DUF397 domain-containing protein, partial [Streptomyces sp. NPDC059447]|uniref:DUF397 domain-containing protein n=1 Tax=Streptomyces sp. NPDC059447 TaxID=3346834 RepID=UPI00367ED820
MSIKPSVGGPSALSWVKSSYSAGSSNECVEVAVVSEAVLVRDSKDVDGGAHAVAPPTPTGGERF